MISMNSELTISNEIIKLLETVIDSIRFFLNCRPIYRTVQQGWTPCRCTVPWGKVLQNCLETAISPVDEGISGCKQYAVFRCHDRKCLWIPNVRRPSFLPGIKMARRHRSCSFWCRKSEQSLDENEVAASTKWCCWSEDFEGSSACAFLDEMVHRLTSAIVVNASCLKLYRSLDKCDIWERASSWAD